MGTMFDDNDGALVVTREMVGALLPRELAWRAVAAQVQGIHLFLQIDLAVDMRLATWVQALILTAKTISWVLLASSA